MINIFFIFFNQLISFNIVIFSSNINTFSYILLVIRHLILYPTSISINYVYNLGFLLGTTITIQAITGLILTLSYYSPLTLFSNLYYTNQDYYYGYTFRNIHITLASTIHILILLHIYKSLIYTNNTAHTNTYITGTIIYIILIATTYIGYILTYGQQSYWGATVIINIIPQSIATLVLGTYSITPITINRYLLYHIILTLIIYILTIIHLYYLHVTSSLPVIITNTTTNNIIFTKYLAKDVTTLILLLTVILTISLYIPLNLSHTDNLNPINTLVTPSHIIPEWYFLYLYTILKIVPSKNGGLYILITLLTIITLPLPLLSTSIVLSEYPITISIIIILYITYTILGIQYPLPTYINNARILPIILFITYHILKA